MALDIGQLTSVKIICYLEI